MLGKEKIIGTGVVGLCNYRKFSLSHMKNYGLMGVKCKETFMCGAKINRLN
jgi:hypothetical protein